jgi:hypothetical protein
MPHLTTAMDGLHIGRGSVPVVGFSASPSLKRRRGRLEIKHGPPPGPTRQVLSKGAEAKITWKAERDGGTSTGTCATVLGTAPPAVASFFSSCLVGWIQFPILAWMSCAAAVPAACLLLLLPANHMSRAGQLKSDLAPSFSIIFGPDACADANFPFPS